MIRVILESPFAGDVERNVAYARMALRDSVLRGEAPIASHLLFTQPVVLDDDVSFERGLGIEAGLAWLSSADLMVLYVDYGESPGMIQAAQRARDANVTIERRRLFS